MTDDTARHINRREALACLAGSLWTPAYSAEAKPHGVSVLPLLGLKRITTPGARRNHGLATSTTVCIDSEVENILTIPTTPVTLRRQKGQGVLRPPPLPAFAAARALGASAGAR